MTFNPKCKARVWTDVTSPNPFTKPNHFEKELAKEKGLPRDLAKDGIEIEALPNGEGGLV